MAPNAILKIELITTWLLRGGVFLISIIFTLALSMFKDTKQDVEKIKADVNQLLQYRAGDIRIIENLRENVQINANNIIVNRNDIRALERNQRP